MSYIALAVPLIYVIGGLQEIIIPNGKIINNHDRQTVQFLYFSSNLYFTAQVVVSQTIPAGTLLTLVFDGNLQIYA